MLEETEKNFSIFNWDRRKMFELTSFFRAITVYTNTITVYIAK